MGIRRVKGTARAHGAAETVRSRPAQSVQMRKALTLGVLAVAAVLQIGLSFDKVIAPTLRDAWRLRNLPAVQRGITLAFGEEFAGFIQFVDSNVPPDARLVLPRPSKSPVFGNVGLMQFMLFPRELINCPSGQPEAEESCILGLGGLHTYILAVEGFPPREAAEANKVLLRYDDERGVYVPRP
jgi:hypothetical protein